MKKNMTLIVMSAGESTRFRRKCNIKKHWLRYNEKPLWQFVADEISSRYEFDDVIITACARECAYMRKFCDYEIIEGASSRQGSLQNALKCVQSEFVMVSDAARFNIDFDVIERLLAHSMDNVDCLVPVIGVRDTIFMRSIGDKTYLDRDSVCLVQTPQISRLEVLKNALRCGEFSDESSAIHSFGGKVESVAGSQNLHKITHVEDLDYFPQLTRSNSHSARVGYGFDVHRFVANGNKEIFLGGVNIPCDVGIEAHSDGDVVIHALCDALLGAVGAGDIGECFPPNDERYKGADSKMLLREVVDFIWGVGFHVVNIDIMIMAQKPIILPHKNAMITLLGDILKMQKNSINIKATTMERLGFVGREEGLCVSVVASLAFIF